MNKESIEKFQNYTKEYLLLNGLSLEKPVWNDIYHITNGRQVTNDYMINKYVKDYSLVSDKRYHTYKLWDFIRSKDKLLSEEIFLSSLDYPRDNDLRKEYMKNLLSIYCQKGKDIPLLLKLVTNKNFLFKNFDIVFDLCQDGFLSLGKFTKERAMVIDYYNDLIVKNEKFNRLDNVQKLKIITDSKKYIKNDKKLQLSVVEGNVVTFRVEVLDLIDYSLDLSTELINNLLKNFVDSREIGQLECSVFIGKESRNAKNELQSMNYIIMTPLSKEIIENFFLEYVNQYIDLSKRCGNSTGNRSKVMPSDSDVLDCLRFSLIKTIKDSLNDKYPEKQIKNSLNKV